MGILDLFKKKRVTLHSPPGPKQDRPKQPALGAKTPAQSGRKWLPDWEDAHKLDLQIKEAFSVTARPDKNNEEKQAARLQAFRLAEAKLSWGYELVEAGKYELGAKLLEESIPFEEATDSGDQLGLANIHHSLSIANLMLHNLARAGSSFRQHIDFTLDDESRETMKKWFFGKALERADSLLEARDFARAEELLRWDLALQQELAANPVGIREVNLRLAKLKAMQK